jgi:hypothetical protein
VIAGKGSEYDLGRTIDGFIARAARDDRAAARRRNVKRGR